MASIKKKQEETMASIDSAKVMVDKIMQVMELVLVSPSLSITYSTNPIKYLLQILEHLGVTYEELRFWLTNFLIYVVPALEISVKTILLTNLKNMISCSVDPRIPAKYRKQHKKITDYNTSQEYGIDINIESIDFLDKLSVNPLSDYGSEMYFGLEGVEDAYKFARADDMDAFLWFVIHKGKFPNSAKISDISDIANTYHGGSVRSILPTDATLLSTVEVKYETDSPSTILMGNTFIYDGGSHIVSMCIDRKLDDADNITHNTLVPVSDDWSSVNWYARKADQLGKNIGFGWSATAIKNDKGKITGTKTEYKGETRDFSKERGICNIQYIDQASSDAPLTGLVNNKFRFTILPKPLIHIPDIELGEAPWRFKKMLFNDKGEYDSNGKFTLVDIDDNNSLEYLGGAVTIDPKSGKVTVNDKDKVIRNLVECYPGLTVFEFNYDYVMSIKLFDAKSLATSLLDALKNARLDINVGLNKVHQDASETIKEIIKNIIETDDSELKDCYYTFDNSKYDHLLRLAEEKRARQERFGDITHTMGSFDSVRDILEEYSANAELHEQVDVLHRAITQAAVIVSDGVDDVDKYDVQYNFVFDLIENLVTAIVNSILTPKLLMLLEVNQKIMGGTWEKFTMADLLKAMRSIIVGIVKEVRDLILQELLKLVIKQLTPIIQKLAAMLLREQVDNYANAIMDVIRNCPFIWFSFGNQDLETKLDTVDYADIDASHTKEGEQPTTNNC